MNNLLQGNVLLALGSAVLWGGGDFTGGMGVKTVGGSTSGALRIVILSHLTSLSVLLAISSLRGAAFLHGAVLGWAIAAGVAGGLSLTAFYIALSRGSMGVSAALSGLLAAAIPAAVSIASDGSPGWLRLTGFLVAGAAIWLIAAGPAAPQPGQIGTTMLALAAGAGFGLYFVALKMASSAGPLWTMAAARMGSLAACSLLLAGVSARTCKVPRIQITPATLRWVLLTALMDTGGNMLFVAATRAGRLDVAAVLASLYPATTILLAAWTLRERPSRRQVSGMLIAALSVVLITL